MKKAKTLTPPPLEMFKDCQKLGVIYYNLDYPNMVDEMYEASNVWRYKLALDAVFTKLRELDRNGFEYEEMYEDKIGPSTSRVLTRKKKSKIHTDAFEHIIKQVYAAVKEQLDNLDW